jgi:hypothetical protein
MKILWLEALASSFSSLPHLTMMWKTNAAPPHEFPRVGTAPVVILTSHASGDPYLTCRTLPDRQVNIEKFPEAKCELRITPVPPTPEKPNGYIHVMALCVTEGVAVETEETAPVSDCETIYGAVG